VPALPFWLADPLCDQFAALLPPREMFVATHPWGCHRRRIPDRIVFDKLIQVLRFRLLLRGNRRHHLLGDHPPGPPRRMDQAGGVRPAGPDRPRVLRPHRRAAARPPRRGRVHHQSPRRRRGRRAVPGGPAQTGHERSVPVEGYGIPLGRVLAGAQRHDSPLLDPTLDLLADLGPLPDEITVHLA